MHPALSQAKFEKDLAGLTTELCEMRAWTVFSRSYPVLDVGFMSPQGRQLRLKLRCEDWNEQPPSVELLQWDGSELTAMPPSSTNIFHPGRHPVTQKFFVCMVGTREYHTHPNHVTDHWHKYSQMPEYRLGEIVSQIWNAWRKSNP